VAAWPGRGGAPPASAILTTIWPSSRSPWKADHRWPTVARRRHGKGSGIDPPGHGHLLAYASCDAGVPAPIWQAMVGRAVARLLQRRSRGRRTPSTKRLLPGLASRAALNPEPLSRLEAGPDGVSQHWPAASPVIGEGATCLIRRFRWGGQPSDARRPRHRQNGSVAPPGETAVHWPRFQLGPGSCPPAGRSVGCCVPSGCRGPLGSERHS